MMQFASPSIDAAYLQSQGIRAPSGLSMGSTSQGMQFEQQPNVGGLGMGMVGQERYYGQGMVCLAGSTLWVSADVLDVLRPVMSYNESAISDAGRSGLGCAACGDGERRGRCIGDIHSRYDNPKSIYKE